MILWVLCTENFINTYITNNINKSHNSFNDKKLDVI